MCNFEQNVFGDGDGDHFQVPRTQQQWKLKKEQTVQK